MRQAVECKYKPRLTVNPEKDVGVEGIPGAVCKKYQYLSYPTSGSAVLTRELTEVATVDVPGLTVIDSVSVIVTVVVCGKRLHRA